MHRISRNFKLRSSRAPDNAERLYRRKEAAAFLGVSVRWLEGNHDIPVVDLARHFSRRSMPRYRESDLKAYIAARATREDAGRS